MKRFVGLCVVLMLTGANLMAQSSPIKISVENYYNQAFDMSYPKIHITSTEDNLEIKNILVNKGHCKIYELRNQREISFPKKLQYSEQMHMKLSSSCNIIRIEVVTNQGNWSEEY